MALVAAQLSAEIILVVGSRWVLLYIHRDHKDYKGRVAQDGHLDFSHTAELCLVGIA